MIQTFAVTHYRSLQQLITPLQKLNVITGPNGSGKSNLYRALRLLADSARDGLIPALAREGGMPSAQWAGPETITNAMIRGSAPIQGGLRKKPVRLRLGFGSDSLSYSIAIGLPAPSASAFALDPEIKSEHLWVGPVFRPSTCIIQREGSHIQARRDSQWIPIPNGIQPFEGLFDQVMDRDSLPEIWQIREDIRSWRFYDHFRTDAEAATRYPCLATRTPVLHHDGRDLASAWQTMVEMGDPEALHRVVEDAFPQSKVEIESMSGGRLALLFHQHGLLRPLAASELSEGTLRYLLWIAALLTPRPPSLMVLNEPETSLHASLLPPLARLIGRAAQRSQMWIISHSAPLIEALEQLPDSHMIRLQKTLGRTQIEGQDLLSVPRWNWPE